MRIAVVETLVFAVVLALCLFVPARTLAWPMAWGVIVVHGVFAAAGLLLLPADLLAERSRLPPDSRPADLLIAGMALLLLIPATVIVSAFDHRWHWSPPVPGAVRVASLGLFALGYAVSMWAAWSNPFFSAVVRIQRERGHRVVSSGPYALVRHPGYAGPVVAHLGLPVALGSLWGLVPALLGCACLMVRIGYEERVLRAELPGYRDYAERVRWRLVPRVW
jgi:protein-S-isoprenylcysteine O-methyltransferase Ste14